MPPIVHEVLRSPGQPLDSATRAFMEPRFGREFSRVPTHVNGSASAPAHLTIGAPDDKFEQEAELMAHQVMSRSAISSSMGCDLRGVRIHTDARAADSARAVNARAYTVGQNIVFGADQYKPDKSDGRRLLAHELQHVGQQSGSCVTVQRQYVPDTGFRYALPATVKRSIIEIQGIVGVTPDGVYGENTRRAVEKYQTKLIAEGLYTDTVDGKWGNNTEAAHVAFAIALNPPKEGFNCAGFALKDYKFHSLTETKAIYGGMTKLADCSKPCTPFGSKFWLWQFNLQTIHVPSGASTSTHLDFHTVGGQTDKNGNGPNQVMSKNGRRPVEGPKPPLDWELKSGPAPNPATGLPMPDFNWVVSGTTLECFCGSKLP